MIKSINYNNIFNKESTKWIVILITLVLLSINSLKAVYTNQN